MTTWQVCKVSNRNEMHLKKMWGVRDGVSSATCCECNLKHFLQEVYWFHRVRLRRDLRPCYTPIYPRSRCKFLQLIRHVSLKHGWSWGWHQVRNTGRRKCCGLWRSDSINLCLHQFSTQVFKGRTLFLFEIWISHPSSNLNFSHIWRRFF